MCSFVLCADKDLAGFEDDEDSGLSSSPSTPGPADNEAKTQLFEFENGLNSNLCDTLNMCLFDGELPTKLYTHIKIKEEFDDEPWQSNSFPGQPSDDIFPYAFGNVTGFSADFVGEQLELLDDLLTPSLNTRVDNERTEILPFQTEKNSKETSIDDLASSAVNTDISTNTAEESATAVDRSPEDIPHVQNPLKRQLRTRNKVHFMDDHNYVKSSDEASVVNSELNDDELDEKIEETEEEDDDEDFKPTCSAKKSRRTSNPNLDKDAKYWERRKRNNLAAKRSREAKRAREMAVAKKTSGLEKENANLKRQVQKLKAAIAKAEKKLRAMV